MNMNRSGAIVGDALRQAFMPKDEYESLREEEKVWGRLQRPLVMMVVTVIWLGIVVSAVIALIVVFPGKGERRFCQKRRIQALPTSAYLLTEEEAVQYFWFGLFLPTAILFGFSIFYFLAGIAVAYTAPQRHGWLKIVENNYCASKRVQFPGGKLVTNDVTYICCNEVASKDTTCPNMAGISDPLTSMIIAGGVRCLATLNIAFAISFAFCALLLGPTILTLESDCSTILFRCYEVVCWGLVVLFGGTAFFLRRKAAVILDEGEHYGSLTVGLEMLEAPPQLPEAELERRINAGFKSWMGSSLLSSDEEDGPGTTGLDDVWEDDDVYSMPTIINATRP